MCCVYHPWGTPGYLQHHTFTSCLQYRPLESCDHSFGCPAARGSLHNYKMWDEITYPNFNSATESQKSRGWSVFVQQSSRFLLKCIFSTKFKIVNWITKFTVSYIFSGSFWVLRKCMIAWWKYNEFVTVKNLSAGFIKALTILIKCNVFSVLLSTPISARANISSSVISEGLTRETIESQ